MEQHTGDEIRELREEAGMTQTELAPLLGWKQSYLSQVETGKKPVNARTWLAVNCVLKHGGRRGANDG